LSAPLPFSAPADASPIADYTYQYNQAGQKTQETLSASGQANEVTGYSYDGIGRLSQAALPDGTVRAYGYDADSNRTSITNNGATTATYVYNPSGTPGVDQLTSVTDGNGTRTYAYTADGQVKSYAGNAVSWDGWQRIASGTFGTTTVTYHYDPSGGLKSRTSSNGASTRYLLGDLFETDGVGAITTAYVDGPAGDLAQYAGPPIVSATPTYLYYNGHGDLAGEADGAGTKRRIATRAGGRSSTTPRAG
jgi:YD repeat-containing protein